MLAHYENVRRERMRSLICPFAGAVLQIIGLLIVLSIGIGLTSILVVLSCSNRANRQAWQQTELRSRCLVCASAALQRAQGRCVTCWLRCGVHVRCREWQRKHLQAMRPRWTRRGGKKAAGAAAVAADGGSSGKMDVQLAQAANGSASGAALDSKV
jgi:hypothetical protein